MIKATDRMLAGFLTVVLLVSPLRELVRLAAGLLAGDPSVADSWWNLPLYLGGLLTGYAVALATLVSLRLALIAIEGDEPPLLRSLDMGVRGNWPSQWGLLLIAMATVAVGAGGVHGQSGATAEVLVASAALLVALAGPPPPRRLIEGYDPMPYPATDDTDATQSAGASHRIPASATWGFCSVPGEVGAPGDRHTIRLSVAAARAEDYPRMRAELADDRDYAQRVRDGICPELLDLARQLRAISIASSYDHIAELNNVLAMAASICDADQDADGECRDDDVNHSPRYPLQTVLGGHGDARDGAVLAATCLALLGYEVGFVETEGPDGDCALMLAVAAPGALNGVDLPRDASGRQWIYYRFDADSARFIHLEQPTVDLAMGTFVPVVGVIDALRPLQPSEDPDLARPST